MFVSTHEYGAHSNRQVIKLILSRLHVELLYCRKKISNFRITNFIQISNFLFPFPIILVFLIFWCQIFNLYSSHFLLQYLIYSANQKVNENRIWYDVEAKKLCHDSSMWSLYLSPYIIIVVFTRTLSNMCKLIVHHILKFLMIM